MPSSSCPGPVGFRRGFLVPRADLNRGEGAAINQCFYHIRPGIIIAVSKHSFSGSGLQVGGDTSVQSHC